MDGVDSFFAASGGESTPARLNCHPRFVRGSRAVACAVALTPRPRLRGDKPAGVTIMAIFKLTHYRTTTPLAFSPELIMVAPLFEASPFFRAALLLGDRLTVGQQTLTLFI